MNNREIAVSFLELAAAGRVGEAYEKYVHPDFRHHNPYFKGDRQALQTAMAEAAQQFPNKSLEVKRTLVDGDLVAVHSRLLRANPNAPEIAVVHIVRIEDGRIVEEWEAAQELPKDSPNENGAF